MHIVVTGGRGFIGREVVRLLLDSGEHSVTITSRSHDPVPEWGSRVRVIQAYAGQPLSLGRAFTGADVVIHAIQFPNHPVENPRKGRTYLAIDGAGTAVAARVAQALGVRRFVYLSGAGAGQGRSEPWFRAKDQAEAAIRESGMEYALVRPSWIYGPGDRSMNRFAMFCRYLPIVPVIGDGQTEVDPIYVEDVARVVTALATRDDGAGRVLDLGGPERLTMDAIIRTLQRVLGVRRPLLHHPKALMKTLVWPLQWLPEPPLSPSAVDFVTAQVDLDPRPAMEYLGASFKTLEQGLRAYLGRTS